MGHTTWSSYWGACPTYDSVSGYNWNWCAEDVGKDGRVAQDVCPECQQCASTAAQWLAMVTGHRIQSSMDLAIYFLAMIGLGDGWRIVCTTCLKEYLEPGI